MPLPDLRSGPWSHVRQVPARSAPRLRSRLSWSVHAALLLVLIGLGVALGMITIPRLFGYEPLIVHSGSMGDAYPVGSMVESQLVAADRVEVGDVVLARPRGDHTEPVLHRVTAVWHEDGERKVRTKGDANERPDPRPYVLPSRVPVARYHVPWLGYVVGFATTPAGWFLVLVFPAALLTASVLVQVWSPPMYRLWWRHDVALAS